MVSAGPDLSLILPQDTAIVNGSRSYDDFGIVSFCWVRSEDNPAAGVSAGHYPLSLLKLIKTSAGVHSEHACGLVNGSQIILKICSC